MNERKQLCTICHSKYYSRVPEQKRCFDCIQKLPAPRICVYGSEHNLTWYPHYATDELTWAYCASCGHTEVKLQTTMEYLKTAIEHAKAN